MSRKLIIALAVLAVAATSASAGWLETLINGFMNVAIPWVINLLLRPLMMLCLWMIKGILYFNPTTFCYTPVGCNMTPGVDALRPYIIDILIPVYVVALMFNALFFIVRSSSPAGRARSRRMFFRLILGMVFVIYAPLIYQGMLDLSEGITSYYLQKVDVNKIMALAGFGKAASMCFVQCCMFVVALITIIIMLFRWFMVYIYAVFFPLIMFLHFFEITKPYGTKYLKEAIKWIFVPCLQALIFYVMVQGPLATMGSIDPVGIPAELRALFPQMVSIFVVLAGMVTMCFAPMMMTQIMNFVGTAVYSFGLATDNLPLMSIGGVISGQGSGGFTNAHGHFSRTRAYESFKANMAGSAVDLKAGQYMRLLGGARGAVEGHGGGASGGSYGGSQEADAGTAFSRNMPGATSSIGRELERVRRGAGGESGASGRGGASYGTSDDEGESGKGHKTVIERSTEEAEMSDKTGGAKGASKRAAGPSGGKRAGGGKVPAVEESDAAAEGVESPVTSDAAAIRRGIEEARGESSTGYGDLSDLKKAREDAAGEEGLMDLLAKRGETPLQSFTFASPEKQAASIGRMEGSIGTLASGNAPEEVLSPAGIVLEDMREIHRMTNILQKQNEIRSGDTTIREDISARAGMMEEHAKDANKAIEAFKNGEFAQTQAMQAELAFLQNMLKARIEAGKKERPKKKA
ncbi:MAG: hypothetical protein PHG85_06550 [Candidatus Altiarchaeota archaeon]|nr:hypothetical protein [Candidatus Altiarchaeota archaeon]